MKFKLNEKLNLLETKVFIHKGTYVDPSTILDPSGNPYEFIPSDISLLKKSTKKHQGSLKPEDKVELPSEIDLPDDDSDDYIDLDSYDYANDFKDDDFDDDGYEEGDSSEEESSAEDNAESEEKSEKDSKVNSEEVPDVDKDSEDPEEVSDADKDSEDSKEGVEGSSEGSDKEGTESSKDDSSTGKSSGTSSSASSSSNRLPNMDNKEESDDQKEPTDKHPEWAGKLLKDKKTGREFVWDKASQRLKQFE